MDPLPDLDISFALAEELLLCGLLFDEDLLLTSDSDPAFHPLQKLVLWPVGQLVPAACCPSE